MVGALPWQEIWQEPSDMIDFVECMPRSTSMRRHQETVSPSRAPHNKCRTSATSIRCNILIYPVITRCSSTTQIPLSELVKWLCCTHRSEDQHISISYRKLCPLSVRQTCLCVCGVACLLQITARTSQWQRGLAGTNNCSEFRASLPMQTTRAL